MNLRPKNLSDLPDDLRPVVSMIDSLFDELYLVGGAVRDSILGKTTKDLDFAVPDSVDIIESTLSANSLLRIHTEGKRFGTISATVGEYDIQVTSYRAEEYGKGSRKPIVSQVVDIDGDLSRRDFSINAMALSRSEFIDPYDGYGDMRGKIISTVGDPDEKLKEDPLRILRAFRFVSVLGYQIEDRTLSSIINNKANLQIVSSERQGEELKKLLHGKYWSDALNELIETDVFNMMLKSFEYSYKVTPEDVRHEFEKYSTLELEKMDIVHRWCYLIRALDYAEKAAGITSSDIQATAEIILSKSQVHKSIKNEVLSSVSKMEATRSTDSSQESLDSIRREVAVLTANDDPRAMIEEAKLYTLAGRISLKDGKYAQAKREFRQALDITEANFVFIMGFKDEEKKKSGLRGITPYYLSRLKYYVSAYVLNDKLYSKHASTDALAIQLQKDIRVKYIGKEDFKSAIDAAIAYVYRQNIYSVSLETYFDFLNKKNLALRSDQRERLLSMYIESKIRNSSTTVKERTKLYLEKAKLAVHGKDQSEYGLEYYDPYVDHLYNLMLSQASIDKFNKIYDQFTDAINTYIDLTKRERRLWAGERKYYLTSASSLVYALSLAKNISQKLEISRRIVSHYASAGKGFEKNKQRYHIYVEWFEIVEKILNSTYSSQFVKEMLSCLKATKAMKYVDIDEEYLASNKKDIVKKRDQLKDLYTFMVFIDEGRFISEHSHINDKVINGVSSLVEASVINKSNAFTLLKNYLSSNENEHINPEQIELTDRELRQKEISEIEEYLTGESETIEYKSSWAFDVTPYRISKGSVRQNNDDLKKEVVKNIAGFMNKAGGTLLIGVEDDCSVCGLEESDYLMQSSKDPRKKLDNIQLDIRNIISSRLNKEVLAELSIEAVRYSEKTVIKIKVPKSRIGPVIYRDGDDEKYYVRSGTSTDNAGIMAAMNKVIERQALVGTYQ